MSVTESIVEDAALTWFHLRHGYGGQVGERVPQTREVGHGPQLAPGEPGAERRFLIIPYFDPGWSLLTDA